MQGRAYLEVRVRLVSQVRGLGTENVFFKILICLIQQPGLHFVEAMDTQIKIPVHIVMCSILSSYQTNLQCLPFL